jgi:thiamine pyrophosphokinase
MPAEGGARCSGHPRHPRRRPTSRSSCWPAATPSTQRSVTSCRTHATVIAADSGLALAPILGCTVDLVVGDLDSVDPDQLAAARAAGAEVERHPVDKDRTDLAIALDVAMSRSPDRITVVGGHGGRLDHLLANAALFAASAYADTRIVARMGRRHPHGGPWRSIGDGARRHTGRTGQPARRPRCRRSASSPTACGSRWTARTWPQVPHRVSATSSPVDRATVALHDGVLLVVQPGDTDQG